MIMRHRSFQTAILLILSLMAGAIDRAAAADAPAPFAIISPETAAKLHTLSSSPTAQSAIRNADKALTQEPDPMARVHMEGTLLHQGIRDESLKATEDWVSMLDLGLAWQITKDNRYLQAEEKYLNAWMDVYQVSFNPIDETNFHRVILAYDLTRADLSEATRAKVTQFLRTMSEGYLNQVQTKNDVGNWQSHRIKLATLAAYELGDANLIALAKAAFMQQVAKNIGADGTTYDFEHRDALHYAVYDLEPLTMSALAAKAHGEDWFHGAPGQPSVAIAMDWLIPYAKGEKTHEEFVHSPVKFDADRAKAGEKGFSGMWDPAGSEALFQMATLIDPKYQPVCVEILQNKGRPQDWSTLLLEAGN
jgi:hypothetical protein